MQTRWHRCEYDAEYEAAAHPERSNPVPEWEVDELADGYEPNPTTGYDPAHDWEMRFLAQGWAELLAT